jgi:hypothetical protein
VTTWEQRYVRVIVDGGFQDFFDRFLMASGVTELVIVTPWITNHGAMKDLIDQICAKLVRERISTTLVVRNPLREPVNYPALRRFQRVPTAQFWFNDELHAKVYACHCDPHGFAYVGSANLTGRGSTALEVGLLIDGKGEGAPIVDELARLGREDLLNRAGTYKGALDDD